MIQLHDNFWQIDMSELMQVVMEKKNSCWRLVQICCTFVDGHYEVTYSFGNWYDLINYRLIVGKDEEVSSISRIYNSAVYYENEMHELFGLHVEQIKINLKDRLYRIDADRPFLKEEDK